MMVAEHEIGQRTDELIAKWIVLGEYDGPHQAWIKDHGTPVWILAARFPMHSFDGRALAAEYGLPWKAFQAAMAFYDRHRAVIDAKVLLNQS